MQNFTLFIVLNPNMYLSLDWKLLLLDKNLKTCVSTEEQKHKNQQNPFISFTGNKQSHHRRKWRMAQFSVSLWIYNQEAQVCDI